MTAFSACWVLSLTLGWIEFTTGDMEIFLFSHLLLLETGIPIRGPRCWQLQLSVIQRFLIKKSCLSITITILNAIYNIGFFTLTPPYLHTTSSKSDPIKKKWTHTLTLSTLKRSPQVCPFSLHLYWDFICFAVFLLHCCKFAVCSCFYKTAFLFWWEKINSWNWRHLLKILTKQQLSPRDLTLSQGSDLCWWLDTGCC